MPNDVDNPEKSTSRRDIAAIVFALIFPSLMTWVYFFWLANSTAAPQLVAKLILVVVQIGFPLLWVIAVQKRHLTRTRFQRDGLLIGGLFGVAVMSSMFIAYYFWLSRNADFLAGADQIRAKVAGLNIDSAAKFAVMGVFYVALHSLMEEYYWRWFVFAQLRRVTTLGPAIAISSLGFMAHHVIVLSLFFGWGSFLSLFFSVGVAVGGVAWSWLYNRTNSLFGPWLSHALIDAGIFTVGFEIVRSAW